MKLVSFENCDCRYTYMIYSAGELLEMSFMILSCNVLGIHHMSLQLNLKFCCKALGVILLPEQPGAAGQDIPEDCTKADGTPFPGLFNIA